MKTLSTYGFRQSRLALAWIIAVAWIAVLASCASPASGGDGGNLTIYVSGSGSGSAGPSKAIDAGTLNTFSYDVEFSGPNGESLSGKIAQGAGNLTVTLALGKWSISIQAFKDGRPVGSGGEAVTVTAGSQNLNVTMYYFPVWYVDPNGNNDNLGTKTAPLQTVTMALARIAEVYYNGDGDWSNNGGDNPAPARIIISGTVTSEPSPADGLVVINDTGGHYYTYPPIILEGNNGVLEADSTERVLYTNNVDVTLTGTLTLKGGRSNGGGGVLFEGAGDLTITGYTVIKSNIVTAYNGGGVTFGGSGDFTMSGNAVIGGIVPGDENTVGGYGGGVYVPSGNFIMKENAKISGNGSTNGGGGVYFYSTGDFTMLGGTISDNEAAGSGGGVLVNNGNFIMKENAKISGNITSSQGGGGVYFYSGGDFTMLGGTISGNEAATSGGGVYVHNGNFIMKENAKISGNIASGDGGGVRFYSAGDFTMLGGTISGNFATNYGGGVFVGDGTFTKSGNSTIYGDDDTTHTPNSTENTAGYGYGHAVYVVSGSKKRNSTAGGDVALESGSPDGWE